MKKLMMVVMALVLSVTSARAGERKQHVDPVARSIFNAIANGALEMAAADSRAIMALEGKTDTSNNLMVIGGGAPGAQGDTRAIGSLVGKTDANGYLYITIGAGQITPDSICLDATNHDTCLVRDGAANTLAQRNSTSFQVFRIYGTFTDASNYERLAFRQSGTDFAIFTEKAGTGAQRALLFGSNGAQWAINTGGHFVAVTDNANDIGGSGASRPRSIYAGTQVTAPFYNGPASGVIASAGTIAPTGNIHHISGTAAIATITVPAGCTPTCTIYLIPDGLFTTTTAGNISLASTAVVNKTLIMTWDGTKWNPSY